MYSRGFYVIDLSWTVTDNVITLPFLLAGCSRYWLSWCIACISDKYCLLFYSVWESTARALSLLYCWAAIAMIKSVIVPVQQPNNTVCYPWGARTLCADNISTVSAVMVVYPKKVAHACLAYQLGYLNIKAAEKHSEQNTNLKLIVDI